MPDDDTASIENAPSSGRPPPVPGIPGGPMPYGPQHTFHDPPAPKNDARPFVILAIILGVAGLVGVFAFVMNEEDDERSTGFSNEASSQADDVDGPVSESSPPSDHRTSEPADDAPPTELPSSDHSTNEPIDEGAHGTVLAYMNAIVDRDCDAMMDLLTDALIRESGHPDRTAAVEECRVILSYLGEVSVNRLDLVSESELKVVYDATATADGVEFVQRLVVVREQERWLIDEAT